MKLFCKILLVKFIVLFLPVLTFSQVLQKNIQGKIVVDSENEEITEEFDLNNVLITNINTQEMVRSENGNFSIVASLNDSIYFESADFATRKMKINQRIYMKETMQVHLREYSVQLGEAVIKNLNLTGYLEVDVANSKEKIDSLVAFQNKFGGLGIVDVEYIRLEDVNNYWDKFPLTSSFENIVSANIFKHKYYDFIRKQKSELMLLLIILGKNIL